MKHNLYDYQLKTCKHYYEHNLQNGETKELKFKQAEPLINSGSWQMVN